MNYFFQSRQVRSGTNRRFWRVWLPLSFIGFIAIYLAFLLLEEVVSERLDRRISTAAEIVQSNVHSRMERVYIDTDFISKSQITQGFISAPSDPEQLQHIRLLLLNIIKTHKIYDQIRLLSVEGQELVRVNYNNGTPLVVANADLQDKSDRYYFTQALNLTPGKVFVSPLDLNLEQGQIETPYKPVIRFARPLYDENKSVKAVVVLNFVGNILLDNFREVLSEVPGKRMLINSDGYWLSHDLRQKEWGFQLNQTNSIQREYPAIWEHIRTKSSGIMNNEHGRIRFFSIDPRNKSLPVSSSAEAELSPWKLVVINSDHKMGIAFIFEHMAYLYPLLLAYPLGSILLWFWARADSGRAVAEQELVALNRSLEKKVHRRTAELEATKDATILSLATLAETRDNETGQHVQRTTYNVHRNLSKY
ncbi:MAG: cache domain-containing protein [Neptuniibacter sp.]